MENATLTSALFCTHDNLALAKKDAEAEKKRTSVAFNSRGKGGRGEGRRASPHGVNSPSPLPFPTGMPAGPSPCEEGERRSNNIWEKYLPPRFVRGGREERPFRLPSPSSHSPFIRSCSTSWPRMVGAAAVFKARLRDVLSARVETSRFEVQCCRYRTLPFSWKRATCDPSMLYVLALHLARVCSLESTINLPLPPLVSRPSSGKKTSTWCLQNIKVAFIAGVGFPLPPPPARRRRPATAISLPRPNKKGQTMLPPTPPTHAPEGLMYLGCLFTFVTRVL